LEKGIKKTAKAPAGKAAKALVIDAEGAPIGRVCAWCAKQAINGATIDVVNIDTCVITGNPEKIVAVYAGRRHMTQKANPEHAAKWPRRPDLLFKTILKGMLPKRTSRGKVALSHVKAYLGVPAQFAGKAEKFKKDPSTGITLMEICRALGWNK
jgi:large subunit ribosomal protein L13